MKNSNTVYRASKRALALITASALTLSLSMPALAKAPGVQYDEVVYTSLDYYGKVKDVEIVKGCELNGNTQVVDYGSYREIINMTNSVAPVITEGSVTWNLEGQKDEIFYFDAKTDALTQTLPWDIDVSYKLNGRDTAAEKLAGAKGLVSTIVKVTPNKKAPEYYKNNMILAAAFMVDLTGDNYSIAAPGAQIQTLGTMKNAIFMALPGEECTFQVDIGSNSYESMGCMLFMLPATLSSLDMVTDIREVKDKVKDSLDAMNDSADVILDNVAAMKDSLELTRKGMEQSKKSKAVFDASKQQTRQLIDASIDILDNIAQTITSMSAHTAAEQNDLNSALGYVDDMRKTVYGMKDDLEDMEDALWDMEDDVKKLRSAMKDVDKTEDKVKEIINDTLPTLIGYNMASQGDLASAGVSGTIGELTAAIVKASIPVTEDGEDVVHQAANLCYKGRSLIEQGNALGGHMTSDYKDNLNAFIDDCENLMNYGTAGIMATQAALRSVRTLMEATSDSLDSALNYTLDGLIGLLNSGMGVSGGTEVFRNAKNVMKDAIDDEIDEIEGESNVLNIDTKEAFPSFTSTKNASPRSIQVILRTEEISLDNVTDNSVDIEVPAADIGIWGRIKAVFAKIFSFGQ